MRERRELLTNAEARRALFIDYEGSKGRPPTLLGVLCEGDADSDGNGDFRQYVLEPAFHPCAGKRGARYAVPASETDVLATLAERCECEDRLLVAWSEHDRRLMESAAQGSATLLSAIRSRYRNAIPTAKRWLRLVHPRAKLESNALALYLDLIRYHVPEWFGPGVAGETVGSADR